jgi:hypothetical protein
LLWIITNKRLHFLYPIKYLALIDWMLAIAIPAYDIVLYPTSPWCMEVSIG